MSGPPSAQEIWRLLCQRIGYGEPIDVAEDIKARFGDDAVVAVAEALHDEWSAQRASPKSDPDRYAVPALKTIPAPLFLDALEIAIEILRKRPREWPSGMLSDVAFDDAGAISEFNRLFGLRGIHYQFDAQGKAQWTGDPGTRAVVVEPALVALQDLRLAGAASEFQTARDHLRAGTAKDLEDAIDEAAKAGESAMKVLLDEHGQTRTGKETAMPLFGLLRDAGVVEAEADSAVLGAARIRNEWGGHGAGATPRAIPDGLAQLAVHSAASALTYLASRLP
jgi:hypothetical protein